MAKCYHLLSASLAGAVRARLLTVSPCQKITLPRPGPMPDRYLGEDELAAIDEHLAFRDSLAVAVLVGTGMRLGEALGLHWENVDSAHGTVRVVHSWDPFGQRVKPPKTNAGRTVPLGRDLAGRLRGELEHSGPGERCAIAHQGAACRSSLVLRGVSERPMNDDALRRRWTQACSSGSPARRRR